MFKVILAFVKAHAIATAITTIVVVSAAIVTPMIIENYKLDKNVRENLDMLVSSDYKSTSDNNETEKNVISNNDEQPTANQSVNTNEPLTFRIEKVYNKTEGGNIVEDMQGNDATEMSSDSIEYKIIPSYDKDFSKWTKAEKEAYQKLLEDIRTMVEQDYNAAVQNENQLLDTIQKEVDLINSSWSENYPCVAGLISYNSYTKQYTGDYWKNISTTVDEGGTHYNYDEEHFTVSAEEFRTVIYPTMLQTYKKGKELGAFDFPEAAQYRQNLEIVYHFSD